MKKIGVTLSLLLALTMACEPENPVTKIEPGTSPASGALMVSTDDRQLFIAAEDHDEVVIIDRASMEVEHRVAVGDGPSHLIELSDGRVAVTSRYSHELSIIDPATGEVVSSMTVGVEPVGLTELRDGRLAVVLSGEEALAIINLDQRENIERIELGTRDPRAVVQLDSGDLYVTHMTAGVVSRASLDGRVVAIDASTPNDFGPTIHANHLRSVTLSPKGNTVAMAHTQSNADTVRAPLEPGVDEFGGGGCGYSGCAHELGAVVPSVTEVNVTTDEVVVPTRVIPADQQQNFGGEERLAVDCFDCGFGFTAEPNPPSVLNPFENRFGGLALNNPTALAFIDGGRGQVVVNQGTQNALILRRPLTGAADDVVGHVKVGHGANAIAITHDGTTAYVWNQFDMSVTAFDVPMLNREGRVASKFVPQDNGTTAAAEFKDVAEFAGTTTVLLEDALDADVSFGRKLFHDATDTRISTNRAVSCASCHPDGRTDGRTWKFTFGPRNTPQLGGGILETAPFHWPGDVTTHRDLNTMTVLAFMGGTGLDDGSMDAIGAFIDTIRAAPARTALASELPEAAARGRELFYDEAVGCAECHNGQHFTDNTNYDIGSKADLADINAFQTPVLHGLSRSGPYLHDGSALTLESLVENWVRTDLMGTGSHLSDAEAADLVAFLKTL